MEQSLWQHWSQLQVKQSHAIFSSAFELHRPRLLYTGSPGSPVSIRSDHESHATRCRTAPSELPLIVNIRWMAFGSALCGRRRRLQYLNLHASATCVVQTQHQRSSSPRRHTRNKETGASAYPQRVPCVRALARFGTNVPCQRKRGTDTDYLPNDEDKSKHRSDCCTR